MAEERKYIFRVPDGKGFKEEIVPESDLSHEQIAMLANTVWRAFMELPDIAQDLLLARLKKQLDADLAMAEEARKKQSPPTMIVGLDGLTIKGEA